MLHWLYLFMYLFCVLILSLFFLNKNLLSIILVGDVILLLVFVIMIVTSIFINIYYLIPFSFFILILGGLELSLNLLLILS